MAQYWLSYIDALIKLDRIEDAKAVFNQAKTNGAKGEILDQIGKLDSSNSQKLNLQEPPQEELKKLINLYTKVQYKEVLTQALQLREQFPTSINLYNIIGAANNGLGELDEAIEAYTKAISIKPDYAEAYNNMGLVLQEQGKLNEAIEAYKKALSIKPNFAEAFNNMGNTLKEQGKLDEAIAAYKKALFIKPNFAEAYNNMGNALKEHGKLDEAIAAYNKALSIRPNFEDALYNIAYALKGIVFTKPKKDLLESLVSLLDKERYVRPRDIVKAAISLLKFEPSLRNYLKLVNIEIIDNPKDIVSDLSKLPLLMKLMSICPLPDLSLENLLKKLRASLLMSITDIARSPELLKFQSALALQCFTNEYIYSYTEEEETILQALDVSIKKALENKEQPNPQAVLALASYKPLNQYDWCNLLVFTDDIKEVFCRQVEEPKKEEKLKQDLPILDGITNSISLKVREQYEESPYPRWVKIGLSSERFSTGELFNKINLKLYDNRITEVEKPAILVAGCGTGQHSIGTSSSFKSP